MKQLDLRGVPCPMNWVKTKLELEGMNAGDQLWVLLDPGEPFDSVPASAREDGHDVRVGDDRVTIIKR